MTDSMMVTITIKYENYEGYRPNGVTGTREEVCARYTYDIIHNERDCEWLVDLLYSERWLMGYYISVAQL